MTPNVIKSTMIITIPMFLNLSIIYFYYSTQENAEIKNIIFYSATSVIYIFCHILYLIKMINLEITIFILFIYNCYNTYRNDIS